MVLELKLREVTNSLNNLIQEIERLSKGGKNFILCFNPIVGHGEATLYLQTCKGLQQNSYAPVKLQENLNITLCIINYSIALHANISVKLNTNEPSLVFEISAEPEIYKSLEMFVASLH